MYMGIDLQVHSFSRSRNDYQFHDVSNPINNTDRYNNPKVPSLQFENLNQFLQDARHYLTNELLMGGISGNKDSKKIHRTWSQLGIGTPNTALVPS